MLVSIKTKNNNNEVVTRGILTEVLDEFGKKFGGKLLEKIDVMIDTKLDTKIDKAIGDLAIMIQNGFMATAKQEDLLALTERMDNFQ